MLETIAMHKKELAEVLNKLPEILEGIGIDCNISVDNDPNFLSLLISLKTEDMIEWIAIVRDFENKTKLVRFWRYITGELVTAFICMSKTLLSATLTPTAKVVDYFTIGVYCESGEKVISWVVYPKPDCIEVEESGVGKEVLSWEEYLRKLLYTMRLVMEVGSYD